MRDLDTLRSLGDRMQPPALALLEETARRRDRRAAVTTVGTGLAAALLVAGGAVALGTADRDRSLPDPVTPVSPSPTPQVTPAPSPDDAPSHASETAMRPREVVHADNAQLRFSGVSADDPNFMLSVWTAECTWCPADPEGRRPWFNAMAVTTDGWRTATYRRPPMGAARPFYVHSPAPGVLLVVDDSNGGEWLIREDGSSVRLTRVVSDVDVAEPRRWFVCLSGEEQSTWCAVDVDDEIVYERRGAWSGTATSTLSAVNPATGTEPWGREVIASRADPLLAWWYDDGQRRSRTLVDGHPTELRAGAVLGADEGDLLYWAHGRGDGFMRFFVGDDLGARWRTIEQRYPADSTSEMVIDVLATPEGTILMRSIAEVPAGARTRIWRLDSLEEGEWTLVHDTGGISWTIDTGFMGPLSVVGDRLVMGTLSSDDDGRSWTGVDRWR
ncbi:hypothetical protein [Nocardioides dilutus]